MSKKQYKKDYYLENTERKKQQARDRYKKLSEFNEEEMLEYNKELDAKREKRRLNSAEYYERVRNGYVPNQHSRRKAAVISEEEQQIYIEQLSDPILVKKIYQVLQSMEARYNLRDETVQNTLVRAFERVEIYDPSKSKFHTWVCQIAKNEYKQLYRGRKDILVDDDVMFHNLPEEEPDGLNEDYIAIQYQKVLDAIYNDGLLQKYEGLADTFIKWHSSQAPERMTMREIGLEHGIAINTIKTIWKRVREKIASQMENPLNNVD